MIVERTWYTARKLGPTGYEREFGQWLVRSWRGWFLFGVIPIYVKETHRSYKTSIC